MILRYIEILHRKNGLKNIKVKGPQCPDYNGTYGKMLILEFWI